MHTKIRDSFIAQGDFVYRHEPIPTFVKAYGSYLEDSDGYKYFDAEAANGTASLGFDNTILQKALDIHQRLPSIPSFCETDIRKNVAEELGELMQKATGEKGRIAFELGGAQGIELALKVIKSNTKKSQFVVFEGGYHGRSIFSSQLSASHRYRALMGDWRIPVIRLPYPDFEQTYPGISTQEARELSLQQIRRLVDSEIGGMAMKTGEQDVAALIIEPLLNAGGIVKPDKEYVETIVNMFRKRGALIIVDEIFCGFYRTGTLFGFQHYDFTPDIVILSKALTNGITPLSCVWAKEPYMSPQHFPPGTHSATYVNNPLALSVAHTVLNRYKNWKTIDTDMKNMEKRLQQIIDAVLAFSSHTRSGYSIGGLGRILLKESVAGKILDIALTISREKPVEGIHGLILASTGMAPNVIALNPPLTTKSLDFDIFEKLLVQTFRKAETIL